MVRVWAFEAYHNNWKKNKKKRWRDLEGKSGACHPRDTLARAIMLVECRHDKHDARVGEGGEQEHRPEGRVVSNRE